MLPVIQRTIACAWPALLLLASASAADENELFPRPAGLEPDIAFWTDIYTRVETSGGVIHDARFLNVRYQTLIFPEGSSRRTRSKLVERRKKHYRTILKTLARGKREGLTTEQQQVLALWPSDVSNKTLSQAANRIRFQLGQADRFKAGLIRSGQYKPFINETLAERNLPPELAALPHVESSFDPTAYSKVGAAGMWQFTRSTGRRYMRVDHVVDERRDPYLSTVAAARLLENNYAVTGSWPLALTGYNHGVAGMRRAARQQGTKDIETIVRNYRSRTFGFASRNFYVAFVAALQVDQRPEQYFGNVPFRPVQNYAFVPVDDYVDALGLAEALNLDQAVLRRSNPALQETVWSGSKRIPKGFTLRLPSFAVDGGAIPTLDESISFAHQLPDVTHRVQRGDTLSRIAGTYGVRVSDLVALNGLRSRHRIRAGQLLRLPTRGQPVVAAAAPVSEPQPEVTLAKLESPPAAEPEPLLEPAQETSAFWAGTAAIGMPLPDSPEPYVGPGEAAELDSRLATAQPVLAADPSDYSVADNGSIEVQAMETLGHYADWLELRTQRLRDLNGYSFRRPVVVGRRISLDFSAVDRATFEARRVAYHQQLQGAFFTKWQIRDSRTHTIRRGESIWVLAQRKYEVPVWLLRQYNPDLDLDRTRPGTQVQFPMLEPLDPQSPSQRVASVSPAGGRP